MHLFLNEHAFICTLMLLCCAAFLPQNIFLDDNGNIKLIDLEDALGLQWTYWGLNSVLIPTTQVSQTAEKCSCSLSDVDITVFSVRWLDC